MADAGVVAVINAATNYDTAVKCLEYSHKYPNFYCVLGIHPEYADFYTPETIAQIETLALKDQKVVGIRETGLDYHYLPRMSAHQTSSKKKFYCKYSARGASFSSFSST